MSVETPPIVTLPGERKLTLKEMHQRTQANVCINRTDKHTLCDTHVNVGVFFDGTGNNMLIDRPRQAHSNIVVLHDTYRNEEANGFYRIYVPGVGTPFEDVGEEGESQDGKSQGAGGDARINWALLRLINLMHYAIHKEPLISPVQTSKDATSGPLHRAQSVTANESGKTTYFGPVLAKLEAALKTRPPMKLALVNVSVFGFSRGAAQARAFCHFLERCLIRQGGNALQGGNGAYTLAGVPFRLQFLGLFDSVASVGLSNSSKGWRGLGGWANGTQDIGSTVERTVHLVAAHEIRTNFPLSTARIGDKYPANAVEKVYPGSHSDVGGGYAPKDQGKSMRGRSSLLSQMPLLDMYNEARASTVPLLRADELRNVDGGDKILNDLKIDPDCVAMFNAYRLWSAPVAGAGLTLTLHGHTQYYWRWRIQHMNRIEALPSYTLANQQDRTDIRESNGDFVSDVLQAQGLHNAFHGPNRYALWPEVDTTRGLPLPTAVQDMFVKVSQNFASEGGRVPPLIDRFFDEMVHDSHASFYMVGPATSFDRGEKIKQIERKLDENRRMQAAAVADNAGGRVYFTREDLVWSLSTLERSIYELNKGAPQGSATYPQLTDADREQLLAMETVLTSGAVRVVTKKTRRELGGHVCYRDIFDKS